jgi:uncharacterized protein DUF1552
MLRAAGTALALPWLESLPALAASDCASTHPRRFAVLVMGNGVNGNHWWARGRGAAMMLSRSLQPLEPLKSRVNVINGLFNEPAVGMGIHPAQMGNLLSGVRLREGPDAQAGTTVDQILADRLGRHTPLASLAIASEAPATGLHETGYSLTYSSHLSWRSASSPAPVAVRPRDAFDCVFPNRRGGPRQSIVDRVKDPAGRLAARLGASDRIRLDSYLTRVREVEMQVHRTDDGEELPERLRLMCEVVALAFQADRTRVASLLLARDLSSLTYPFLGVRDDHHAASHDDLSDAYERIVRFHVSLLAYLAARLDSMPEGGGTVLDNCCLVWLSNMWSGWKHDNRKLPVVTVGSLGSTLETGRSLEYLYAGDENRRLCSLYLSIMRRMGVSVDRFGDADRPLEGL